MAVQRKPGAVPAEDVEGLPREGLPTPEREAGAEEETQNPRGVTREERDPREAFNAIPDGDGPRSDRGTNPLPETYWSAFPDRDKPR